MSTFLVGAGKACVNSRKEWFPFKTYSGLPMTDIIHDLYTRVIVIDNGETKFLFLCLESGASPDLQMKKDFEREFGIPAENMIAVWTHNHSAPMHWSRSGKREHDDEYYEICFNAMRSAIRDAITSLRPAKWGFGEGKSYINVNRDKQGEDGHWIETSNFEAPSDKTLAVMKFVDLDGNLIGAVLNYCCHATAAFACPDFDGNVKGTGGFTGYACDYIEGRYPGSVAVWTSGAAGDQNPIMGPGWPLSYNADGTAEMIEPPNGTRYVVQKYLGETHALDAIHTIEAIDDLKDEMSIKSTVSTLEMPAHKPEGGISPFLAFRIADNAFRKANPDMIVNGKPISEITRVEMIREGTSKMQMQLNILGDVAWVGASGELYCDIGMQMKDAFPMERTVVVTHTEGNAMQMGGYIISDAAIDHDTFQRYHTQTAPGGNDKRIIDNMLSMYDKIK